MTDNTPDTHPYFIEDGDSRKETAILLVGTADEYGIDQHDIQATQGGFNVTEAVAKAVYGDDFEAQSDEDEDDNGASQTVAPGEPIVTGSPKDGSATVADPAPVGAPAADDSTDQPDYESWDYGDLKSAVATRNIETTDQRKETLVAALIAADQSDQSDAEGDDL